MPVRRSSVASGLCSLAPLAAGCTHITHPAEVRPGLTLEVSGGAGATQGQSGTENRAGLAGLAALQVNAGYGWRFNEDQALATTVMLPIVTVEHLGTRQTRTHALQYVGFDAYWQLHGDPDWGLGVVIDQAPRVYAIVGQDTPLSSQVKFRWDTKLAVGVFVGTEDSGTLLVAQGLSARFELGPWDVGAWLDAVYIPAGHPGEEGASGTRLAFGGGALLGLRWSAIDVEPDAPGPDGW